MYLFICVVSVCVSMVSVVREKFELTDEIEVAEHGIFSSRDFLHMICVKNKW